MLSLKANNYFPAFVKLDNKKILLVGGGNIAYEKLVHLLDFSHDIEIITPLICDKMLSLVNEHGIKYQNRVYEKGDIKECSLVVVAVDDISVFTQRITGKG